MIRVIIVFRSEDAPSQTQTQTPFNLKNFCPGKKIAEETELQEQKGNRMGLVSVHKDLGVTELPGWISTWEQRISVCVTEPEITQLSPSPQAQVVTICPGKCCTFSCDWILKRVPSFSASLYSLAGCQSVPCYPAGTGGGSDSLRKCPFLDTNPSLWPICHIPILRLAL